MYVKTIKPSDAGQYDIEATFDCGQCFRFERSSNNAYEGVALGEYIRIEKNDSGELCLSTAKAECSPQIEHYLALDCDYDKVRASVRAAFANDAVMERAMEQCGGLRILRQDPWEALCSFIISQNNNIPRIKGIIRELCRTYGDPIETENGVFYSFPDAATVAEAGIDGMATLRTGFRAKYINAAAVAVADGSIDLAEIAALPTNDAINALCGLYGVGVKVASCTALFGMSKTDAFPVDVWVKRILEKYYPQGLDVTALGEYAGVAQQYLFHYERLNAGVIK